MKVTILYFLYLFLVPTFGGQDTVTMNDGWTMVGNKGGFMAQHEHTIVVTDGKPIILTRKNEM